MKTATLRRLLCLAAVVFAASAHAHGLWIEQTGDTKTLFFGEPENGVKEIFPGKLESIKTPQAMAIDTPRKAWVKPPRTATGFDLGRSASGQGMLVMDVSPEVKDWTANGMGLVKPMFYARYAPTPIKAAAPELELDIVPTDTANRFLVTYKGQPLKKAKLHVIAPNTWTQEFSSDEQGQVAINTPWRGQYVLEVTHLDKTPGEFEGKRYEATRHRAMLTFVQVRGEKVAASAANPHSM